MAQRWDTARTEVFSDGVIAIAITLLVLDIRVPVAETHNLWAGIAHSFLPFPTSLVAETIRSTNAERAAVIFYGASLLVIRLLFSALWAAVAKDRELLKPQVSEREVTELQLEAAPNIGFYVGATALAIVAPRAAAFVYLGIALLGIVRVRGDATTEIV